ncbi:unnamed protein product [Blepharisma stoltei]|uniref:Uncharacterized protein n=1 Tax=Blepharisma stoltei TaxID=1481888 RepID=A0AAU9JV72_9CILI|nr:unnamed protein product [Blepharisma stoltei]
MEDHCHEWFLSTLHEKKSTIRILETGICRGDKLKAWYTNDELGKVIENSIRNISHTRFMLVQFLNMRAPMLYEYEPDKVIVYLYHTRGRKVLTAKDIVDLSKNQLHGLQVRSIHMALLETYSRNILKVKVWQESGELRSEILIGKFNKEGGKPIKDMAIVEKTEAFTIFMAELIYQVTNKLIQKLQYDLEIDGSGHLHLIRLNTLEYVKENGRKETVIHLPAFEMPRPTQRKVTLRYTEPISDDEEDGKIEMNLMPISSFKSLKKPKEVPKLKFDINHPQKEHSPLFVDMMAKTFEKIRMNEIIKEKIERKRKMIETNTNCKLPIFDPNIIKKIHKDTKNIKSLKDLVNTIQTERVKRRCSIYETFNESNEVSVNQQLACSPLPIAKIATPKPSDLDLATAIASQAYLTERKHNSVDQSTPTSVYKTGLSTNRLLQLYIEEKDMFYSHKYSNTPFQKASSFSRSAKRPGFSPYTARSARRSFDF